MTFTELANLVIERNLPFDREANLPRPNVYWGTVRTNDDRTFNDYVAAAHTAPAMNLVLAMATVTLRMRLVKSNNVVMLRRLVLGDLIENPDAFEQALHNAQAVNDHASVEALQRLPLVLAERLGLIHEHEAPVSLLAPRQRELRPNPVSH